MNFYHQLFDYPIKDNGMIQNINYIHLNMVSNCYLKCYDKTLWDMSQRTIELEELQV